MRHSIVLEAFNGRTTRQYDAHRGFHGILSYFQAELENQVYDKLTSMLQVTEAHDQSTDIDRVNDLIKVCIVQQRALTQSCVMQHFDIHLSSALSLTQNRAICNAAKSLPIQFMTRVLKS